ncbi:short chain dehydrogenase [Serratia fonticola]|uniref:Short chain dehydrogenase n=1 Tax=Serratia fonticola TaxID=47917 RepID=A0A4U9WDL9_SERFO|nr:short chain dehydrogenase [Serratia fonticola]
MATGVGGKTMMEYDIDLWDKVMQVNVRGTWLVSQAAVPLLAQTPHAKNRQCCLGYRFVGCAETDGLCGEQRGDHLDDPLHGT